MVTAEVTLSRDKAKKVIDTYGLQGYCSMFVLELTSKSNSNSKSTYVTYRKQKKIWG